MADHRRARAVPAVLVLFLGLLALVPAPAASAPDEASTYRVDDVTPRLVARRGELVARVVGVDGFTTIGVSATSPSGGEGRVRAHLPGGWTPWFDLHASHGGPEPIWVGEEADGYEVRLPADARAVTVHLVRPTGEQAAVTSVPTTESAEGFNPAPAIRRREAWGAAPFRGTPQRNSRITRGVVHHTVNTNTYAQDQVPAMLRSIQAFHQGTRGWPDIAYNFVVDRFGTIWEARERSYEDPIRVSATSGTDMNTVTVAYLGDGSSDTPPRGTIRAMGRLLGWKLRRHGLLPSRSNIVAHGDLGQTSCPGAALRARIPRIEDAAMAGNPPPGPYWDVPWTSRNAQAINWAGTRRIIPGYPDQTFRPSNPGSRADAVVWMWRLAGQPPGTSHPFTDVPDGAPYEEPLEWASGNGYVRGVTPTRFAPGRAMSRLGMIDMLWRWQGEPQLPVDHGFDDAAPRESLDWARESRMIGGTTFRPTDPTTRGVAAAWLYDLRPFTDVPRAHPARTAVDWARAHVIVTGFADHTFQPDQIASRETATGWIWRLLDRPAAGPADATPAGDPLTRAAAVTWLWQAAGSPTVDLPSGYTDVASGDPHEMAAAWSEDHAILPDVTAPTFGPGTPLTRADLVRALYRLASRPAAWAVTPPTTVTF
ncbi:MAG TPA: S-layer homology domain-containing protein [Acidimicrobiales bacterium]|nr:S-layer homology domain-containing protein [Acidimicrobiales bacterium]